VAEPANIPTPPAYDFTDEGLRIWQDGKSVATIPHRYYGGLVHALVEKMAKESKA
jgi:hypothetical protein